MAITTIKTGNTTKRNKYYRVRVDALHDAMQDDIIQVHHVRSQHLPADALTKSLSGPKLLKHKMALNVKPLTRFIGSSGGVEIQG